jgi:hypothetical protein
MVKLAEIETFTIVHPHFPEHKVIVIETEPTVEMDLISRFSKYQRVIAVQDREGNLIRDEKGNLETVTITNLPSEAIIQLMSDVIKGWEGLEGVPYSSSNIKFLFNKKLICKTTDKDGKEKKQSWLDYIKTIIDKRSEETLSAEVDEIPKLKGAPKQR